VGQQGTGFTTGSLFRGGEERMGRKGGCSLRIENSVIREFLAEFLGKFSFGFFVNHAFSPLLSVPRDVPF
jgi:hypothetical protein